MPAPPCLSQLHWAHDLKLNEMNEMSVENWWNEICGRGKREKPREKPTQIPLRSPPNPYGVAKTRTRDPSGGGREID